MATTDLISPMKLAKKLGVRPQIIYGLIRRGKILKRQEEPAMVSEEEATNALKKSKEGGNRTKKEKASLEVGDILSHTALPSDGPEYRRTMLVEGVGETLYHGRDARDRPICAGLDTLAKQLKTGHKVIEHPLEILNFIIKQWRLNQRPDLAVALQHWLDDHIDIIPRANNAHDPEKENNHDEESKGRESSGCEDERSEGEGEGSDEQGGSE